MDKLQVGDIVELKENEYYNFISGAAFTLMEKGIRGKIVRMLGGKFIVIFETYKYRINANEKFGYIGKNLEYFASPNEIRLVRSQSIRNDEFIDDKGNIRRKVGPIGHGTGMGFYNSCPRCGGKFVTKNQESHGYGSQSSSTLDLVCSNCGWSTYITLD